MSDADTTERPDTLYVTDAEMIRRMGVPEKIATICLRKKRVALTSAGSNSFEIVASSQRFGGGAMQSRFG